MSISPRSWAALVFTAMSAVLLALVLGWRMELAQNAEMMADRAAINDRVAADAAVRTLIAMRLRDRAQELHQESRLAAIAQSDPALAEPVRALSDANDAQTAGAAALVLIDAAHDRSAYYENMGDDVDSQGDAIVWILGPLLAAGILVSLYSLFSDWRKANEQQAVEAQRRSRAEANAATKSLMLAAASHDVRQPLHAMSLLLSALKRRVEGDEPKRIVGRIEEAAGSLRRLFSSLLDVARLEAGVVEADPHDFALEPLLKQLIDEAAEIGALANTQVSLGPAPFTLATDPQLLEAIVRNLLSNAVKVSPGGTVRVTAEAEGAHVRIEVRDTGADLDAGALDRLLAGQSEPSVRVGLGLFIVREMAKILALDVRARAAPGGGAIVSVTAPAAAAAPAAAPAAVR